MIAFELLMITYFSIDFLYDLNQDTYSIIKMETQKMRFLVNWLFQGSLLKDLCLCHSC